MMTHPILIARHEVAERRAERHGCEDPQSQIPVEEGGA